MRSWLAVSWALLFLILVLFAVIPQEALALTASQVYEQVKNLPFRMIWTFNVF
jgi:hypothetical protein